MIVLVGFGSFLAGAAVYALFRYHTLGAAERKEYAELKRRLAETRSLLDAREDELRRWWTFAQGKELVRLAEAESLLRQVPTDEFCCGDAAMGFSCEHWHNKLVCEIQDYFNK